MCPVPAPIVRLQRCQACDTPSGGNGCGRHPGVWQRWRPVEPHIAGPSLIEMRLAVRSLPVAIAGLVTIAVLGVVILADPSCNDVVGLHGHCGTADPPASGGADPKELQHTEAIGDLQKMRLLVVRTNRCASTAFGGWILRAVHASHGRLEAYRADDGEVARTGVTAWAAHANDVMDQRAVGPFPPDYTPYPPMVTSGVVLDDVTKVSPATSSSALIVAFLRSPPSQFASAYGSFKSSQMGHYGESLSDTLSRPPQPENWRLDNMNARSLGWGPLESGAWDKKLTPDQERHGAGVAPQEFVDQVEREVDLVLIVEHMVESMVLLRRALGIDASALQDNLAMLIGINGHLSKSPMSPDDMQRVCSDTWSSVDCALFEHFNATLWARVEAG
eukprot:20082_1